ncbi:hypothetical protein ACFQ0T_40560 [Kitasatospora gansuensis]
MRPGGGQREFLDRAPAVQVAAQVEDVLAGGGQLPAGGRCPGRPLGARPGGLPDGGDQGLLLGSQPADRIAADGPGEGVVRQPVGGPVRQAGVVDALVGAAAGAGQGDPAAQHPAEDGGPHFGRVLDGGPLPGEGADQIVQPVAGLVGEVAPGRFEQVVGDQQIEQPVGGPARQAEYGGGGPGGAHRGVQQGEAAQQRPGGAGSAR